MNTQNAAAGIGLVMLLLAGCTVGGKMNKMLEEDFSSRKQTCTDALGKTKDRIDGVNKKLDSNKYMELRTGVPSVGFGLNTGTDCMTRLHEDVETKRKELGISDDVASETWQAWVEAELKQEKELEKKWNTFIQAYEQAASKRVDGLLKDLASPDKEVTYTYNLAGFKESIGKAEKVFKKAHDGQAYLERLNTSAADSERLLKEIEEQKYEEAAQTLVDVYIDLRAIYWESFIDNMVVPSMMIGEKDKKKRKGYMYAGDMHVFIGKLLKKWEAVHGGIVLGLVMIAPQSMNREILKKLTRAHEPLDKKFKADVFKNLFYLNSKIFEKILTAVREQEYDSKSKNTITNSVKPYFEEKDRLMQNLSKPLK